MSRRTAFGLYALLVIIWSSTWVAIKIGLEDSPALLGAGIRFTLAGALLLGFAAARHRPLRTDRTLAITLGLLPFAFCYGLIYPGAIAELLKGAPHAVVADGDPIVPPLHIYVEGTADVEHLRAVLRTPVAVHPLAPGDLPVAEHKAVRVFRTARGDALPDAIRRHREAP